MPDYKAMHEKTMSDCDKAYPLPAPKKEGVLDKIIDAVLDNNTTRKTETYYAERNRNDCKDEVNDASDAKQRFEITKQNKKEPPLKMRPAPSGP